MDKSVYYGYIIKGDLHGAIDYIKQFPEQADLYNRFMAVFEHEQYIAYEVGADLNAILVAYQRYYRDVFYLRMEKEKAEIKLKERLAKVLEIFGEDITLCDLEQNQLADVFRRQGLHFVGGRSGGYYGPYVWRTTEKVSYDVEIPDGVQTYTVKLLDGFIARSWIDYLSFGEIGSGGWTDGDGCISCVKSAWNFDSESFRVSLLKHEAQHAWDISIDKDMSSEDLEYRAKLVELIYSSERNLLENFAHEADATDRSNGHAMAAHRIMQGFADNLDVSEVDPATISVEQVQAIAKVLFENCTALKGQQSLENGLLNNQ